MRLAQKRVIEDAEVTRHVADVCERLRRFSPNIEPYDAQPGVFWIDASGLERLYPSLRAWAREIAADLQGAGFECALTVGFSRFGSYALARARPLGVTVFDREVDERLAARDVPLDRLDVKPRLRDALHRLGVTTVGEFVRLPPGGILKRFGKAAHQLHVLDIPDEICLARLRKRNAEGGHAFAASEEQFRLISSHFVPPSADEQFNVVRHGHEEQSPA